MRTPALHPVHARRINPRITRVSNMASIRLGSDEARQCIEGIALGIFTDMTNAGCTLQQTLAAIYLSGTENAVEAMKEQRDA